MVLCFLAIIVLSFFTGIALGYILFEFYIITKKDINILYIEGDEVGNFLEDIRRSRENGARMLKYDVGRPSDNVSSNFNSSNNASSGNSNKTVLTTDEFLGVEEENEAYPDFEEEVDYDFLKKYYYDSLNEENSTNAVDVSTDTSVYIDDIDDIDDTSDIGVQFDDGFENPYFGIIETEIKNKTDDETTPVDENLDTSNPDDEIQHIDELSETSIDFDDYSYDYNGDDFSFDFDAAFDNEGITDENSTEESILNDETVTVDNPVISDTEEILPSTADESANEDSDNTQTQSQNIRIEIPTSIDKTSSDNTETGDKIQSNVNIVIGSSSLSSNATVSIPLTMTSKPVEPTEPPKRKRGRPPKKKK